MCGSGLKAAARLAARPAAGVYPCTGKWFAAPGRNAAEGYRRGNLQNALESNGCFFGCGWTLRYQRSGGCNDRRKRS